MTNGCWPSGYKAAALFSFDVDGEAWLLGADQRNQDLPVTLSQARYGPTVGVFEILRVLQHCGTPSTFFIPSAVAEAHPDTVRAIVADGHEIGLHGHLHERPDLLDEQQEREITVTSIKILTEILGEAPVGYRAPGAEVSRNTIAILAEHGIRYTSQHMDDVFPYYHPSVTQTAVLELPIHWTLDDWSYSMQSPWAWPTPQVNSIQKSRDIIEIWSDELDAIHEMGGLFVLVNHPQVTGRPGRLQTIDGIIKHAQTLPDLWIATGEEIDRHWRANDSVAPGLASRRSRPALHT